MKLSARLFLLATLILIGCDPNGELNELRTELNLAELKLALAASRNENNLITDIDSGDQVYTIHFESGDPITLKTQWIKALTRDSANWLATFHLFDGTDHTANFIGILNFDEADVIVNPYLTSPLTALAEIKVPVQGKFNVSVKGKPGKGVTIEKVFDYFPEDHEIPVLGLYADYANEVEFIFMSGQDRPRCSKTVTLKTAGISDLPPLEIEVLNNQLPAVYGGLYVLSNLSVGFDQTGEIRWYYNTGGMFFDMLANGNFVVADPSGSNFSEVTILGQDVKEYHVPNGLHHEIFEMPNGNFLVASNSPPGFPYEDVVVEISRSNGAVVKSWDFKPILDPLRRPLPNTLAGDWLHINALYYDESDNGIVISGRSQCAVVKIDYATGAIRWILGNHNEWGEAFLPFLLKPVDTHGNPIDVRNTDFWMYGQHAIHRLPNGNVLLYDNGDYRGFYDDPNVQQNSYTRIVEYKINEQQMTVELLWHFDNNKDVFTKFTGYTQHLYDTRLAAYMFASENTPKIVEVNTSNQVVYEATINRGKASYYRTLKLDLYGRIY